VELELKLKSRLRNLIEIKINKLFVDSCNITACKSRRRMFQGCCYCTARNVDHRTPST